MFYRYLIIAFMLFIGGDFISLTLNINQPLAAASAGSMYIEYVWIDNVRWAFEYEEDGTFIRSYPDPE